MAVMTDCDKCPVCNIHPGDNFRLGECCSDKCEDIYCGDFACPDCGGVDYPCPCHLPEPKWR